MREAELAAPELARLVGELADRALRDPRFAAADLDLLRALLYLQRNDQQLTGRVLKYLRCEDLAPHDRERLGHLVPLTHDGAPLDLIERLGRLMWAVQQVALVLCLDQIEDIYTLDDAPEHFRRAEARHRAEHRSVGGAERVRATGRR